MKEMGKPFPKSDKKFKKVNHCQNSACEQKTTSEKENWYKQKIGLE